MKVIEKDNLESLLLRTQFIRALSADDKKTVVASTRFIPFSKGENIFKQGATINEFVVLLTPYLYFRSAPCSTLRIRQRLLQ